MQPILWFLLYSGSSPDGMGRADYVGRTTDQIYALQHLVHERLSPYNTGDVWVNSEDEEERVSSADELQKMLANYRSHGKLRGYR
jgi:isopentenyl phosphate kinase